MLSARASSIRYHRAVVDLSLNDAIAVHGVHRFDGYYENAYRLLFAFEDHYQAGARLLTILPGGEVDTDELLKSEKGEALFAYGYSQSIDMLNVETLKRNTKYGEAVDRFIWQRDDDSFCLVQTWPTHYNDAFKKQFIEYDSNPAPAKFAPSAVKEFHDAMVNLFGEEALNQPVKYVISRKKNEKPVYVGLGKQLIGLLGSCAEVRNELGIPDLAGSDGFLATIVCEGEADKTKEFHLSLDHSYALYVKKGDETMACCKPLDQFHKEAVFHLPIDRDPEIPPSLLATPLPKWSYDPRVARLFLNDEKLILPAGLGEIPRPIPIDSCVGPAIYWAFWRAVILWTCVLSTTFFGYVFVDQDVLYTDFRFYHRVLFLIAAIFGLWAEWKCVKFFIVPFVERVLGCAFPLLGSQPFRVWLPSMMLLSFVSMLSIQLNAEFMLTTMRREHDADGKERLFRYWSLLMEGSVFGGRGVDWSCINPCFCAGLMWSISIAQLILPIIEVTRVWGATKPQYEVKYNAAGDTEWETYYWRLGVRAEKIRPYEALQELAYAGGMATIGCGVYQYPLGSMRDAISLKGSNWVTQSMEDLNLAQKQALKRLFIDGFLKKTLQLKIQVTLYSLDRAMSRASFVDWWHVLPILVTLFTGLESQIDTVYMSLEAHHRLKRAIPEHSLQSIDQGMSKSLLWHSFRIALCGLIILCGVAYTAWQLYSIHFCSSSMWNLSGCVLEPAVLHSTKYPS